MKRYVRMLAALLALGLVAAACGNDDDTTAVADEEEAADVGEEQGEATTGEDSTTDEGGEAATTDADITGVDLQLWGWSSSEVEDAQLTNLVEQFNTETGASAQFQPQPEFQAALQAALVAGEPPDLFYVDSFNLPDLAEDAALQPVPDGLISSPDDIYPSLREVFTIDGTWYCPPKDFSTLALVYDPTVLDAAGVSVPTTWDELSDVTATLTTGDQTGLALTAEYARVGPFLFQAGSGVLDDAGEVIINNDGGIIGLQYLADLFDSGSARTPADLGAEWEGEAFADGSAAMTVTGNWIVPFLNQNFPDKQWAVAELPAGPSGPGTFAFTVCYGVPSAASNPDASWAMVEYLTNEQGATDWTLNFQVMPARESVREPWLAANPELEGFLNGADYASRFQFPAGVADLQGVFDESFQRMVGGEVSPEEVIENVVEGHEDLT